MINKIAKPHYKSISSFFMFMEIISPFSENNNVLLSLADIELLLHRHFLQTTIPGDHDYKPWLNPFLAPFCLEENQFVP
jgi:hypothetical protein